MSLHGGKQEETTITEHVKIPLGMAYGITAMLVALVFGGTWFVASFTTGTAKDIQYVKDGMSGVKTDIASIKTEVSNFKTTLENHVTSKTATCAPACPSRITASILNE